jgi:hypothetical protein
MQQDRYGRAALCALPTLLCLALIAPVLATPPESALKNQHLGCPFSPAPKVTGVWTVTGEAVEKGQIVETWTFDADGTFTAANPTVTVPGTYTEDGAEVSISAYLFLEGSGAPPGKGFLPPRELFLDAEVTLAIDNNAFGGVAAIEVFNADTEELLQEAAVLLEGERIE